MNTISEVAYKAQSVTTNAQQTLDGVGAKLDNNIVSSITVITIFSAVVLTFSGSFSFESGILQGIHTVSKYRLIFVIALTGFVLFNTVFVLLYLVGRLVDKPISKQCKYSLKGNRSAKGKEYYYHPYSHISIWCKLTHQYAYNTAINIILLCIMCATYVSWHYQSIIFPLLLFPVIVLCLPYCISLILEHIQKKRSILSVRLELVTHLLAKSEETTTSTTSNNLLESTDMDTIVEEYKRTIPCDDISNIREFIKRTDMFIEANKLMKIEHISRAKHELNKITWEKLSKDPELKQLYCSE